MIKRVLFEAHWLLGVSAGLVIAVVGFTGGMLSFKDDIQRWMNPGLMTVEPMAAQRLLSPGELFEAVSAAQPDKRITSINLSADPQSAARVMFAPPPSTEGAPRRRGETRYVDPYTGAVLEGEVRGQAFFRVVEDLHRRLVSGDTGKQIVGASTIVLIVLALSGLYLRWPRRPLDWRAWLKFDFSRKGRSFLWNLHSVSGTWVLPVYLLASLTGLYWSYDWYRDGLFRLTGVERPNAQGAPPQSAARQAGAAPQGGEARAASEAGAGRQGGAGRDGVGPSGTGQGRQGGERDGAAAPALAAADIDRVWTAFRNAVAAYSTVGLRLPERPGQPFQLTYLDVDPPHERASNRLVIDAGSGTVSQHERYTDKTLTEKLMGSMLPLHSGSYFGLPGLIVVMVASLLMPLFFITGWMLYLDRRRNKRAARAMRTSAGTAPEEAQTAIADPFLIGFASQSGYAERLAWQTAGLLRTAGVPAAVQPLAEIDREQLGRFRRALFVVSTFGDGEPPDSARNFARRLMRDSISLGGMNFGLLALGDRHYRTFCGFGRALDEWLCRQGARPLFDRVEVDNGNVDALRDWQARVGALAGIDMAAWSERGFGQGRLVDRRLTNHGSVGGAAFHLAIAPAAGERWDAGDLVEIVPRNPPARVAHLLTAAGLDGDAVITGADGARSLRECLGRSVLPDPATLRGSAPANVARGLRMLPARRYSIGSLPEEGVIHLLVRQHRRNGGFGLASGWLTEYARIGEDIEMRVLAHPTFRGPQDDRPLILVGNGTGISGLRAHIKARARAGRHRNWLLFGERSAAHDFHYREEIEAWRAQGVLARVDLAFSRDQEARIYVQDRLAEAADTLRAWVEQGASIYVCGSAEGMASGVDRVLAQTLGQEALDRLTADGRYRRDVY